MLHSPRVLRHQGGADQTAAALDVSTHDIYVYMHLFILLYIYIFFFVLCVFLFKLLLKISEKKAQTELADM